MPTTNHDPRARSTHHVQDVHHVVLREGTRVLVRRLVPTDRDRLVAGLAALSPQSRRLRFHHTVERLDEQQLTALTEVDQQDHLAWVALDEDRPEVPGAGIIRAIRLPDEPSVAEAALTIADEYQGRGLGTVLLGLVRIDARAHGMAVLRSWVMADNAVMLDTFQELGATFAEEPYNILRVDLPTGDVPLPDTPTGRVLRDVEAHLTRAPAGCLTVADHADASPAPRRTSGLERGGLRQWFDATMVDPGA